MLAEETDIIDTDSGWLFQQSLKQLLYRNCFFFYFVVVLHSHYLQDTFDHICKKKKKRTRLTHFYKNGTWQFLSVDIWKTYKIKIVGKRELIKKIFLPFTLFKWNYMVL